MSTKTPTNPLTLPETITPEKPGGLFTNRNFVLLEIGQAISNIGDFVFATTLLVWVYALTHSASAVSGVLIAQYIPIFILGPVAGVFVDRWNRRTTMIISDLVRAVIALLPLVVSGTMLLPAIYGSVFLLSAFSRLFLPAKAGLLQVIVPEQQQSLAASISQSTFALSFIIGPALATPLYFAVGPTIAILINAVSFLISAISLCFIRASKEALHPYAYVNKDLENSEHGIGPITHELLAGLRFVMNTRTLRMIVFLGLIAMLGAGALNALDIIFVSQRLHVSTELYGPLAAAGGIGVLIGAILSGVAAKKITPREMLMGGVFLTGLGIIVYALMIWYPIAIVVNFIIGIPQAAINVGFGPLMLAVTPQTMIGRVNSVIETSMFGISLVSIGLAGFFGQFVPVHIIFLFSGTLIVLAGLFGWFSLPGNVDKK